MTKYCVFFTYAKLTPQTPLSLIFKLPYETNPSGNGLVANTVELNPYEGFLINHNTRLIYLGSLLIYGCLVVLCQPLSPSIDRIDPNGNYNPENCRWITVSENTTRRHN